MDYADITRRLATELRRNQTDAESTIWLALRNRGLAGYKFRRQHPIGPYIVDFYCADARLTIEVDGGQHAENKAYDSRRTEYLERAGYRVIRFWNNEVLKNTEGVLETILSEIQRAIGGQKY